MSFTPQLPGILGLENVRLGSPVLPYDSLMRVSSTSSENKTSFVAIYFAAGGGKAICSLHCPLVFPLELRTGAGDGVQDEYLTC